MVSFGNNQILGQGVVVADTWQMRTKGLIGRSKLDSGEGLLIKNCKAIHTWFMRFPIDVVFMDKNSCVVKTISQLKPFRLAFGGRSAQHVLELSSGAISSAQVRIGDMVNAKI
ncbi:DUF192 domain-containing protein [bacterium]|nr:DUF192 domain-containing protein [bacterium]